MSSLSSSISSGSNGGTTCIACKLLFSSGEEQREHYKTDLHRFNLKRKIVDLPSVTEKEFNKMMDAERGNSVTASSARRKAGGGGRKPVFACSCGKKFSSQTTLEQHERSKKHASLVIEPVKAGDNGSSADEDDVEEADDAGGDREQAQPRTEEEWIQWKIARGVHLDPEDCLFCTHRAASLADSLEHMGKKHGFVVPDLDAMVDLDGFVAYVAQKVSIGNVCLRCSAGFHSMQAVRSHMVDKQHCRLPLGAEDADEYFEFYEYETADDDEEDGQAPDDGGASSTSASTSTALMAPGDVEKVAASRPKLVAVEAHRLLFSDGRSVGHRSLRQFYRQKMHRPETRDSVLTARAVAGRYKMLGLHAAYTPEMKHTMREQKFMVRRKQKHDMQLGSKSNALFVVRPQVIF